MNRTSIIIVAYNSERALSPCLASTQAAAAANQASAPDIIVVDNSPHNRSQKIVNQCGGHYLKSSHNLGFAAGANKGAKVADPRSEYLLFLNPDTIIPSHALTELEHFFGSHPDIAIAGPILVNEEGYVEVDGFGQKVTPPSLIQRHLTKSSAVDWLSGAALAIRRSVFEKIGGFDPSYFMYWEDVDLCRRVRKIGGKIAQIPHLKVIHQRNQSLVDQKKRTQLYDASADHYFRKYYSLPIWLMQRSLRSLYRIFQPFSR